MGCEPFMNDHARHHTSGETLVPSHPNNSTDTRTSLWSSPIILPFEDRYKESDPRTERPSGPECFQRLRLGRLESE